MEAREDIGNDAMPGSTGRRPRLTPIVLVLVLAMSGTAGALAGRNSVDSGDIRNGQVKSKDIRAGATRASRSSPWSSWARSWRPSPSPTAPTA